MVRSRSLVLLTVTLAVSLALVGSGPAIAGEWSARQWQKKQLRLIKKALSSPGLNGDMQVGVPAEWRWYVLLLRDRNVRGYIGSTSYDLSATCTVRYVKVRGVETAAQAVLRFLMNAPRYHTRDFVARYFASESTAETYLQANVRAARGAGAKPVK